MRLERENLYKCKIELSKLTGYQPLIYESGVFEFHNIPDSDKETIIKKLKSCNLVNDVHIIKTKYNFDSMILCMLNLQIITQLWGS